MNMDLNIFRRIFQEIINGTSLRQIESKYGINRETVIQKCRELFPENSNELYKFNKIVEYNKKLNSIKEIEESKMKEICNQLFSNKITMEKACSKLNIDRQTFKEKMAQYINNCNDKDLMKQYIQYENRRNPDYSHINFKALLKEMIILDVSQVKIAEEYYIPARTIGRQIEKLKNDEYYSDLYYLCKEHAERTLKGIEYSTFEKDLIARLLDKYDEGPIIIDNFITKEEREYNKAKSIVEQSMEINGTNKQKAMSLGISESTLRRMKILAQNYEMKQELKNSIEEGKEEK